MGAKNTEKVKHGNESKEDMFTKLTVAQIVTVIIIGAVFFIAYKTDGEYFSQLSEGYKSLMAEDMDDIELNPYNFLRESTTVAETALAEETVNATVNETVSETENEGAGGEDSETSANTQAVSAENMPVAFMPAEGHYTSFYGERIHPVYQTEGFHTGVDIGADEGAPIYAALDGTVTECGRGERSGIYVKLDNGGGYETLYCHCSELKVSEGDKVSRGDIIACVGQTGVTTGPHLHFEFHINSVAVDPMLLLEGAVSES